MTRPIDRSLISSSATFDECLAGGGEMGEVMRAIDWANTPMGPVAKWPASLRTMVTVVLGNRFPMCIWWGPELRHLYNDGYRPMLGAKHPASIGQPAAEVWAEIWNVVGPMAMQILRGGPATYSADLLLEMNRYGYLEETYFTFAYSPIPEDNRVGGLLITVQETTGQVLSERRLKTLLDLAARSAHAKTAEEACATAAEILATNPSDVPFALLYLIEPEGDRARLVSSVGLGGYQGAGTPELIRVGPSALDGNGAAHSWPLAEAERLGHIELTDLADRFGPMPGGRWPEAAHSAIVAPLRRSGQGRPYGFLIAGSSPRLKIGYQFRGFIDLAADPIATAIANARAYQEERRRAEALAEIDRAKTAFFSNVSHEFRTPLTLLLGPLEDALADPDPALRGADLEIAHRNALRLLKLVNVLLDFSRIEAGHVQPSFEPTDLASLTEEIVGTFRPLVHRAGLALTVDKGAGVQPAYVDREMWEKIVLNLVSNAFKFTFAGSISVGLQQAGDRIELTVSDTGTGIPEHELPRLFRRFHRVEGARARSIEGSGIGLALVSELVNIHGGEIRVVSRMGEGTTFTVSIPAGSAHLDRDRIVSQRPMIAAPTGAASFVEEAARWLGDATEFAGPSRAATDTSDRVNFDESDRGARIVLVDDNPDMRDYIKRLLGHHYAVETASDGVEALRLARANRPDLVLTDVMMPNMGGFSLLRELRADPKLKLIPIIVISARAGEESRVEGLDRGADDYLVKPFSARELVARVHSHLALHRLRVQTEQERAILLQREQEARAAAEEASQAKDVFLAMLGHELRNPLSPILTSLNVMQMRGIDTFRRERDIIERQVHHLVNLVDDLLDVSRVTRGKIQLKREPVELITEVVKAIEMASPIIEQRMHHLSANVPSTGLLIDADPMRMAQVICNLLTNAAKYTEPGGNIWIRAAREDDQIVLRVRDNGIGISQALLPRVFDLFSQGARALDRGPGGLGIGLTIVKSLVDLHGGSVSVKSDGPGQGSEFMIRLPAADETAGAAATVATAPRKEVAGNSMSPMKVLVVDDNHDAAEILSETLQESGFLARVAFDAPATLAMVEGFDPDVMLIDIGLPVMDGYELAQRLRANPRLASVALIAVTGYGQESDRLRALEAGFDEHVVKPIDFERLREMLHRHQKG
jgi:signal transduction histidine kinase